MTPEQRVAGLAALERLKALNENQYLISTWLAKLHATQAAEIERLRGEVERLAEAGDVMVDWHWEMSPTAKFKRPAHVDAALQTFRKFREGQRHG